MTRIGNTSLDVFPLCLGGNVFGWTADESAVVRRARRLRRRRRQLHRHGRRLLGVGAGPRGRRVGDDPRPLDGRARATATGWSIATKVGHVPGASRASRAKTIRAAAEASLAPAADRPHRPLLRPHRRPRRRRSRRRWARSTRSCARARSATSRPPTTPSRASPRRWRSRTRRASPGTSRSSRTTTWSHRAEYEGGAAPPSASARGSRASPTTRSPAASSPASTGPARTVESARASRAAAYLDDRGLRILAALDEIAAARRTPVAAVALAWLLTRPAVVAPIASARTPEQLAELLPLASVRLDADEQQRLDEASA